MSSVPDSGDIQQAEALLLEACQLGLAVSRVGIWLYQEGTDGIACSSLLENGQMQSVENLVLRRSDFPHYFSMLDQQRVIAAYDARQDPATSEFTKGYLQPRGIFSMLDVPIRHRGQMVGIICCEQTGSMKRWTDDETSFVAAIADLYGRALMAQQKVAYQRDLEQLNQQLEAKVKERTQLLEANIDQLQATQAQLVEAEKMASLGALVAGVAHEVNTPIGIAVTANSHSKTLMTQLQRLLENNELSRTKLDKLLEQVVESQSLVERNLFRADELISNFKKTAVDQAHYDIQRIDLADYLQMVLVTLKPYTKELAVCFEVDCQPGVQVQTYPGAIAQVLTNLVINACVHAFHAINRAAVIRIQLQQCSQQGIQLTVCDNGKGIPPEVKKRVFEPFFTTRRGQGGSGLGLAIVYNLVTNTLQGKIELQSEPEQGACFHIHLPGQLKGR